MSQVQQVNATSVVQNRATYNAVKIRIEEPKLNIPEKAAVDNTNDTGEYSAVNIEVTKPEIAPQKKDVDDIPKYSIYDYPMADGIVTYNQLSMVDFTPYEEVHEEDVNPNITDEAECNEEVSDENAILAEEGENVVADNDETEEITDEVSGESVVIAEEGENVIADNEVTEEVADEVSGENVVIAEEGESVVSDKSEVKTDIQDEEAVEIVDVPEPNFTTVENEKTSSNTGLNFHGLNFKAENPNIVPSANIKSKVNINEISTDLASDNYDKQALALEKIVTSLVDDKASANVYISTPIFSSIINIIAKDTSTLAGPTQEQMDIREKIIANSIEYAQAKKDNKTLKNSDLPYQLTDAEIAKATVLSELEMAERNKDYAMITLAGLAGVYADEFQKQTGNVVPLTDLPGASNLVDVLKKSENPSLKVTALESLMLLQRPEYNDELKAIMTIAAQDKNPVVAKNAALGLSILNNSDKQ